jgi:hypothetical protein
MIQEALNWNGQFYPMTWTGCHFVRCGLSRVCALKITLLIHVTILILECESRSPSVYLCIATE